MRAGVERDRDAATAVAAATAWPVLPSDGVRWRFAAPPGGVVAIGDLQGDLCGLEAILRTAKLVDAAGEWIGARRHLVLAGDLIGGHADGCLLTFRVRRLERQARAAGGAVHALLGNHELLPARGEVDKWTGAEKEQWRRHPPAGAPSPKPRDAFRGDGAPAHWLRRRNAVVRIGDDLFAHAGVDAWLTVAAVGEVNATVRAWIAHWQGVGASPSPATQWAVGAPGMARDAALARGPLWTRGFKPDGDRRPAGGPSRADLCAWLDAHGLRRLVVGHAPVDGGVLQAHPYYGDRVAMLDTRIADPRRGRLAALCLDAGAQRALDVPQERRDPTCRERELALLQRHGWHRRDPTGGWLRWLPRRLAALFGHDRMR
ncbi:MAG: metallophosphoesterase [Planctomycetota bacterium]